MMRHILPILGIGALLSACTTAQLQEAQTVNAKILSDVAVACKAYAVVAPQIVGVLSVTPAGPAAQSINGYAESVCANLATLTTLDASTADWIYSLIGKLKALPPVMPPPADPAAP